MTSKMFRGLVTAALLLTLALSAAGQLVRDRDSISMLLLCLPAWPVALVAIAWDLRHRGRALRRRGLLSVIAFAAGVSSTGVMWTPARTPEGATGQRTLRIAQWNVQWGGKRRAGAMMDALDAQHPDVVCLSEAPRRQYFDPGWSARHPSWHTASVENPERPNYWYRLTVTSRYSVRLHSEWDLPSGHAALFEIATPRRSTRLLMVDLESALLKTRTPSIDRIAQYVSRDPVDVVLGDFNATGRFRGFDALEQSGYRRAALWSGSWRATWPSILPLLDIDHVWVRSGLAVAASNFFRGPGIDHRGQRTTLRLPQ